MTITPLVRSKLAAQSITMILTAVTWWLVWRCPCAPTPGRSLLDSGGDVPRRVVIAYLVLRSD